MTAVVLMIVACVCVLGFFIGLMIVACVCVLGFFIGYTMGRS